MVLKYIDWRERGFEDTNIPTSAFWNKNPNCFKISGKIPDLAMLDKWQRLGKVGLITPVISWSHSIFIVGGLYLSFVNSERWLTKSRVDITLCQHGKFPASLLLKFFVLYYKRNIKHFFRIDIQLYQHSWKLENSKLCENTPPCGCRVSTQFLVFPISTRVDITVYQHGKMFYIS